MISKATLLCFGAALAIAAVYVSDVAGKPAEKDRPGKSDGVCGSYLQEEGYSTEDMDKFMKAMGMSEEATQNIHNDKNLVIMIQKDGNKWTITKSTKKKTWSLTFESGKEFEATLIDGRKVKSTVTVDEEKMTIHRVFKMEGFDATSDYVFKGMELNLTMKAKDAKVELKFGKLLSSSGGHM